MTENKSLQVTADSSCFICGQQNPIGFKAIICVDQEKATAWTKVQLPAQFQGWQDVIHGGVVAALLDEVSIYACRTRADQCVTAELQVRFRKPVPVGSEVEVAGQVIESQRKFFLARAQMKIGDTLYAEAEAKVFNLEAKS